MATAPTIEYAKAFVPDRFYKSVDTQKMEVHSVLTYPVQDLEGDFLIPSACDFTDEPYVNYEHQSKAIVGTGSVKWGKVPGCPDSLPIGTTHFAQSGANAPFARQAFDLVVQDVLPGVSLEFAPRPGGKKARGFKSLLRNRPAYEFTDVLCHGWALCHTPVNPRVGHVRVDKALSILSRGKIGNEALHPLICKSLQTLTQSTPKRSTVVGGWSKSMNPDMAPPAIDDNDDSLDTGVDEPMGDSPMKPTPMAGMTAVQGIKDLISQVRSMLDACEHEKGVEKLTSFLDTLDTDADDLATELKTIFAGKGGVEAPDAEDGTEPDGDEPLPETDDGAIKTKAFPNGHPIRYTFNQVKFDEIKDELTPAQFRAMQRELKALKREAKYLFGKR